MSARLFWRIKDQGSEKQNLLEFIGWSYLSTEIYALPEVGCGGRATRNLPIYFSLFGCQNRGGDLRVSEFFRLIDFGLVRSYILIDYRDSRAILYDLRDLFRWSAQIRDGESNFFQNLYGRPYLSTEIYASSQIVEIIQER